MSITQTVNCNLPVKNSKLANFLAMLLLDHCMSLTYHSVNEHNEWLVQLFNQKRHAITFANNITKTACFINNYWTVTF